MHFYIIQMLREDSEDLQLVSRWVVSVLQLGQHLREVAGGSHGIDRRFDPALWEY